MTEPNPFTVPRADLGQASTSHAAAPGFFSLRGRMGRIHFMIICLFLQVGYAAILGLVLMQSGEDFVKFRPVLWFLMDVMMMPLMILGVKRCHDIGMSGWFNLLLLFPYVKFLYSGLLLFGSGSLEPNKYGPAPQRPANSLSLVIITAYVLVTLFIFGILIFGPSAPTMVKY